MFMNNEYVYPVTFIYVNWIKLSKTEIFTKKLPISKTKFYFYILNHLLKLFRFKNNLFLWKK